MAKAYTPENIRNVALVGHGSCGKTCLGEAVLFNAGATTRLGVTVEQTSTLDFEPEEHKRGGSIATSVAWADHGGVKLNILDTPGDGNFIYDTFAALHGADSVAVVVSAPDGVEVQTERVYHKAAELGLPRVFVVNKMDRDRADADTVLADINDTFGIEAVALQVPIGTEQDFKGVVSLLQMKALTYATDGSGKFEKGDISADLKDEVDAAWEKLVETVASTDDDLLEQYLETFELSEDQVRTSLRAAVRRGDLAPVIFTAAAANVGVHALMDLASWALPNPLERATPPALDANGDEVEIAVGPDTPFSAQVIHTFIDEFSGKMNILRLFGGPPAADGMVANPSHEDTERLGTFYNLRGNHREPTEPVCGDIVAVAKLKHTHTNDTLVAPEIRWSFEKVRYPPPMMSYTITATSKGGEGKLKQAVERLCEEDPTITVSYDELSHHLVLNGMGQAHLDMAVARMKRKSKVEVATDLPLVPYRETLKRKVSNVEGKHKKQTGGSGQFGVCYLDVEPVPSGVGFEFVDKIFGGSIPKQYIPSVEKGVAKCMDHGGLAGYPVVDIRVTLTDGKYHPVDSKDVAFQLAGSKGLKSAMATAGMKLLEPVYKMEIVTPTENMGDVMGDITGRRGRVMGMNPRGKNTVIEAIVPLAEIQRYAPDLRSMTGGKGTYTMAFQSYEDVPGNLINKVVQGSPFKSGSPD